MSDPYRVHARVDEYTSSGNRNHKSNAMDRVERSRAQCTIPPTASSIAAGPMKAVNTYGYITKFDQWLHHAAADHPCRSMAPHTMWRTNDSR